MNTSPWEGGVELSPVILTIRIVRLVGSVGFGASGPGFSAGWPC